MKTIEIINPVNDSLIQQLIALYTIFKNTSLSEKVIFDLSKLKFSFPLLVLPISTYIQETKSKFVNPKKSKVDSYLQTIYFPNGISRVSEFQKVLTYIPIGVLKKDNPKEREMLESCFAEMIYKILKPTVAAQNAIYYPLTELTTNIFEHSKRDVGYVFAQYYPTKKFVDLCIVDRGRGLVKTYKEEKNLDYTDEEAIKQVLAGHSTKPELERGYGVRTSKRVICEGLNGSFILLSGSAALYSSKKEERIMSLPNFYWQGVVISYRILPPKSSVDITPYLSG